jgi:hypothetical protein
MDGLTEPERRQAVEQGGSDHVAARSAYEESRARLRLIASGAVGREAEKLEVWVTNNVLGVPPFTVGNTFAEDATAAMQGTGVVERESFELARTFATAASRDVTGRLLASIHAQKNRLRFWAGVR